MCSVFTRGWPSWTLVGLLIPCLAQAELTVIYDNGRTVPIAPYLQVIDAPTAGAQMSPAPTRPSLGAADPESWLPIRSPGLTPGTVRARKHDRPFTRPFFLIGSDARSRRWLRAHHDRLEAIGAVGMLVQAETLDDLRSIAEMAGGLPILPASGSDIAKALGISHYPVLVSAHGIEQ